MPTSIGCLLELKPWLCFRFQLPNAHPKSNRQWLTYLGPCHGVRDPWPSAAFMDIGELNQRIKELCLTFRQLKLSNDVDSRGDRRDFGGKWNNFFCLVAVLVDTQAYECLKFHRTINKTELLMHNADPGRQQVVLQITGYLHSYGGAQVEFLVPSLGMARPQRLQAFGE